MASGSFDLLAADYDRVWTNSRAGRLQRNAVWRHILPLFRAEDRVLDLGCGTGEDAHQFAMQGVRVTAIDASPKMVGIARQRGVDAEVRTIESIEDLRLTFDGAISNFGALNCLDSIHSIRRPLARLIRPQGLLAICIMSRFCLLESLHFLRQLQLRKAARRWSGRTYAERLRLRTMYPTAAELTRCLMPEFHLLFRTGIGLAVPPSYVNDALTTLELRSRIDDHLAHLPGLRAMADHQLFIFSRVELSKT